MITNIFLFIAGLILGVISFDTIILPVFYMFPKAVYHSIKGNLKPVSILIVFQNTAIVLIICLLIGFFFPGVLSFWEKPLVNNGSNVSIIFLCISRLFWKSGRDQCKGFFWLKVFSVRKNGFLPLSNKQDNNKE